MSSHYDSDVGSRSLQILISCAMMFLHSATTDSSLPRVTVEEVTARVHSIVVEIER